ncbi:MAG: hypothetical protein M3Q30_25990 [Actinomycetota bacterium]|nr:hypothetical protein [Actinomycetota bacterium]
MSRARYCGISIAAVGALVAAGCGSAAQSGHGPSTGTTSPSKRLELAFSGREAAASAQDGAPAIFPVRPTEYVLDATLPDLGPRALVRRMDAPEVDSTDAQRFASALGLDGSPVRKPTGWDVQGADATLSFIVSDGRVSVSYSPGAPNAVGGSPGSGGGATTGSVASDGSVTRGAPSEPSPVPPTPTDVSQPPAPVDVPGADAARTIARGLLDRVGVLAGQEWATDVNDSGGVAVACAVGVPCPTVPPQVSARTVTFSLMLDGTRVDGVDWSITIGEHRRIESLNGEWAAPAPRGNYPLRSTTNVFADLQHGKARFTGPQPMTALSDSRSTGAPATGAPAVGAPSIEPSPTVPTLTVHVTGVSLGIARWDAYDQGHTIIDLVPTYRFHTRVEGRASSDIVVLALDPGVVTFTNPVPKSKPLPAKPAPSPVPISGGAESTPTS